MATYIDQMQAGLDESTKNTVDERKQYLQGACKRALHRAVSFLTVTAALSFTTYTYASNPPDTSARAMRYMALEASQTEYTTDQISRMTDQEVVKIRSDSLEYKALASDKAVQTEVTNFHGHGLTSVIGYVFSAIGALILLRLAFDAKNERRELKAYLGRNVMRTRPVHRALSNEN